MKSLSILADVTHPSLAKFFGEVCRELEANGHRVVIVSRAKDRTTDLLDRDGFQHVVGSREFNRGMPGLGLELVVRVGRILRLLRAHEVDIVLTRSPAGCIAGRIAGKKVIFDTDDGRGAGIHHMMAAPFAHAITSPEWLSEDFGDRHHRYPSLKSLAYLHPARFSLDRDIRRLFGVAEGQALFLLRRSSYSASHDGGRQGIGDELARSIVNLLSSKGVVVISSEEERDDDLATTGILVDHPDLLHHVIAASSLVVTDGASVAEEAAVLGTYALFVSDFAGQRDYLTVLEDSYGALEQHSPATVGAIRQGISAVLADLSGFEERAIDSQKRLLNDQVDLVTWYREFIERWAASQDVVGT